MTESINPNDGSQSSPPSGDQPGSINPDAVNDVREAGGLITDQESLALAKSRGRIPSVPSDPAIGNQNSSSHASGPFDMTDPKNQMTDDGGWPVEDEEQFKHSSPDSPRLLKAIMEFFSRPRG
jgi:hypothetical protein